MSRDRGTGAQHGPFPYDRTQSGLSAARRRALLCYGMGGPGGHHSQGRKAVTKGHILRDSTYMRYWSDQVQRHGQGRSGCQGWGRG